MAPPSRVLLLAALFLAASTMATAQKAKAKPAPAAADGPGAAAADAGPPTNVTSVLEKSGKYGTFLRLLHETRVDTQLNSQLYDSYNGLTILAPTDAAFEDLPSGTMNGLSSQDQIQMMLYCVLPRFYSLSMLGTLNGKVSTQASGSDGPYEYKIKPSGSNVNVSTGVKGNNMLLSTIVSKEFPLAVYSVDKVPLPYALFGPQPPTPAPAPAPAPSKSKSKKKKKVIADPPESDSDDSTASDTKSAAAAGVSASRWVAAAALAVLGAAGGVLL